MSPFCYAMSVVAEPPLFTAVRCGDADSVRRLLDEGAELATANAVSAWWCCGRASAGGEFVAVLVRLWLWLRRSLPSRGGSFCLGERV